MIKNILITGGAGFIGSHVADELIGAGYNVRAIDNLSPQVHGSGPARPEYLHPDVELIVGDIRDDDLLHRALNNIDGVFHLAAAVGVGQSMYQIPQYTSINNFGTAVLLDALIQRPIQRLVVASSMSIYGEGLYCDSDGRLIANAKRSVEQLKSNQWELFDAEGERLTPVATPENKAPQLSSVYALSKWDQEQLCLMLGQAYNLPTVALRFFNVFGSRQALSNPYTGVLAIFASRLMNNKPPLIYEDGLQMRDFVSVHDIAGACRLAMESDDAAGHAINIGSGQCYSILQVAELMAEAMEKPDIEPLITGKYRVGDIRHCFADITNAKRLLGYRPRITLETGLVQLVEWLRGQAAQDRAEEAAAELEARGLTV